MNSIKVLLASLLRKLVFSAGAVWIAMLVERGILTHVDVDRFIDIAAAVLLLVVPALWSYVKRKLGK